MLRWCSTSIAALMSFGVALKLMPVPEKLFAARPAHEKFGSAKATITCVYVPGMRANLLARYTSFALLPVASNQLSLHVG